MTAPINVTVGTGRAVHATPAGYRYTLCGAEGRTPGASRLRTVDHDVTCKRCAAILSATPAEPTVEEFGAALDAQTDEEAAAEGWDTVDEEELTGEQVAAFRAEVADALTVEADLPPTDEDRVTVPIRAAELRPGDLVVDSLGGHRYAAFDVAPDDTPRPVPAVKVWTAIRDQENGLPPVIRVPAASEVLVLRPVSEEGRELLAALDRA